MNKKEYQLKIMLESALNYAKSGLSVIPIGTDKKPLIKWMQYQNEIATEEQIREWFEKWPDMNIGIVTGKISNLAVIDIDPRHGGKDNMFKELLTPHCRTGGGGWHYYFQASNGIGNKAGLVDGIDLRAEGGYVIAPPSKHKSGNRYQWVISLESKKPLPMPDFVSQLSLKESLENEEPETKRTNGIKEKEQKFFNTKVLKGVAEGKRNDSAASVAGKLLRHLPEGEWKEVAWPLLQSWNSFNKPPLPEKELKNTFESIKKKAKLDRNEETETAKKISKVKELVGLVQTAGLEVRMDQYNEAFATNPDNPFTARSLSSRHVRNWIRKKYWQIKKEAVGSETLKVAAETLEAIAISEENPKDIHLRVARLQNRLYYDLGDDKRVVEATPEGWKVITNPPVLFKRLPQQKQQVIPKKGGNLRDILKYTNFSTSADIPTTDEILFLTYLPTILVPNIPRVILVLYGDQGSAKSTSLRAIRLLIDPSSPELLTPPDSGREFVQAASHNYVFYLDNMSYLKRNYSDALCRLATGGGFQKRKLYTDDEDILYDYMRAAGLNGINLVATQPDLLDRSLIFHLQRVSDEKRKAETSFWENFEKEKPYLLGALFDAVSAMLRIEPDIVLKTTPRMADYARYAAAAAEHLGYGAEAFIKAFEENIKRQNQDAIEASPVAQTIIQFLNEKDHYDGRSSDLYAALKKIAEKQGLVKHFPKAANWLWRKIQEVRPNLQSVGISVQREERNDGSYIKLMKK